MLVVHARAAAVQRVLCAHAYLTPCEGGVLVEILNKWRFREVFVFESVNFGDKIKFFSSIANFHEAIYIHICQSATPLPC